MVQNYKSNYSVSFLPSVTSAWLSGSSFGDVFPFAGAVAPLPSSFVLSGSSGFVGTGAYVIIQLRSID